MRMLDLDLDFFLDKVSNHYARSGGGPQCVPWTEGDVRQYLEMNCGITQSIPGRYLKDHHEAFGFWKELVGSKRLITPFDVVHVDAHADLGLGDPGYVYLMTDILWRPVADRTSPGHGMTPGNYLAFAIACQWLSSLTYVAHPNYRDDLLRLHMKNQDVNADAIELKRCTREQIEDYLETKELKFEGIEPEVPFCRVPGDAFQESKHYDFVTFAHSPRYTPEAADALVPVIMEYINPI